MYKMQHRHQQREKTSVLTRAGDRWVSERCIWQGTERVHKRTGLTLLVQFSHLAPALFSAAAVCIEHCWLSCRPTIAPFVCCRGFLHDTHVSIATPETRCMPGIADSATQHPSSTIAQACCQEVCTCIVRRCCYFELALLPSIARLTSLLLGCCCVQVQGRVGCGGGAGGQL
jgi:hypothetical protein